LIAPKTISAVEVTASSHLEQDAIGMLVDDPWKRLLERLAHGIRDVAHLLLELHGPGDHLKPKRVIMCRHSIGPAPSDAYRKVAICGAPGLCIHSRKAGPEL
jgi:hypothetical protein